MSLKFRTIKLSKADKQWSKMVRERDGKCLVCGKAEYLAAHHFIGRANKSVRLELDNGITLCPSCHTFNNNFSAHRTPKDFKMWFKEKYPDRASKVEAKAVLYMSEKQAVTNFYEEYQIL